MIGNGKDISGGIVGIAVYGFKAAVLTYIILDFGDSVKYIINISDFQTVPVNQSVQLPDRLRPEYFYIGQTQPPCPALSVSAVGTL